MLDRVRPARSTKADRYSFSRIPHDIVVSVHQSRVPIRVLAQLYGISSRAIYLIRRGELLRDVTKDLPKVKRIPAFAKAPRLVDARQPLGVGTCTRCGEEFKLWHSAQKLCSLWCL